jgi:hypothetical protein
MFQLGIDPSDLWAAISSAVEVDESGVIESILHTYRCYEAERDNDSSASLSYFEGLYFTFGARYSP